MKILFKLVFFFIGTSVVFATNHNGKHTKEKTQQKTVAVNADATLSVKNKYGNLMITTWDEDKISIEVVITVSGDSEKWVDQKLASISVDFSGSNSLYAAETFINSNDSYGKNTSMEINYTIKIPKNGSVKLDNKYGNIVLRDLIGKADITCKYGRITLGNLKNSSNSIKIDYCPDSTIESINKADIQAKYSGLSIQNYNVLNLNSSYTDLNFPNGKNLTYQSNYGKINLGKVENVDGKGNYLTIKINEVLQNLKIATNYSNLTIAAISDKAKDIVIDAGYTNIKINHPSSYYFDFTITTKYGTFKSNADLTYSSKIQTQNTNSYKGFYKKSGVNQLAISSHYGNINLIQN